jgi:GNAT superfamily N-acetyltransferase
LPVSEAAMRAPRADLLLRPALPEDSLCLSVLAMQVFLDTYATHGIRAQLAREVLTAYSQAEFTKAIASASSRLVVAEIQQHLVGFAQVSLEARHPLAPPGVQAELLRLYVQEPFTGTGVGSQLLAAAELLASGGGASVLWLTPWVHNHRALGFYARRGYTDHGLTHFNFEGESHENRVFAKHLAAPGAA